MKFRHMLFRFVPFSGKRKFRALNAAQNSIFRPYAFNRTGAVGIVPKHSLKEFSKNASMHSTLKQILMLMPFNGTREMSKLVKLVDIKFWLQRPLDYFAINTLM